MVNPCRRAVAEVVYVLVPPVLGLAVVFGSEASGLAGLEKGLLSQCLAVMLALM